MQLQTEASRDRLIVYDADRFGSAPRDLFDPHYLSIQGLLSSISSGRGTVWLFQHNKERYALRHYRRGGWMASIFQDRYPWLTQGRTRPAREVALLCELHRQGLPVPVPAAWQTIRRRLSYRADLITVRIDAAKPLNQYLSQQELAADGWVRLGQVLRRFHDHQVWHADMNLSNILLGPRQTFHLIDFDRCRVRRGNYWKTRNLKRLQRSCRKSLRLNPNLHFQERDFERLLEGYAGSTA